MKRLYHVIGFRNDVTRYVVLAESDEDAVTQILRYIEPDHKFTKMFVKAAASDIIYIDPKFLDCPPEILEMWFGYNGWRAAVQLSGHLTWVD
jgi:hypothetical protein